MPFAADAAGAMDAFMSMSTTTRAFRIIDVMGNAAVETRDFLKPPGKPPAGDS